ncbi:hypothetical protein D3C81_2068040 [compost metagenome]
MVAQAIEGGSGLGGVVEKAVVLDPARGPWPPRPALFKRAGRVGGLAQRKHHEGQAYPVQRLDHQNFPSLVFIIVLTNWITLLTIIFVNHMRRQ